MKKIYLLSDESGNPLAYGAPLAPLEGAQWRVRVPENRLEAVLSNRIVHLMDLDDESTVLAGKVAGGRGGVVFLEREELLGEAARQNLRLMVEFDSYIYPLTGSWKGRRAIRACDLSSGGVAFYCAGPLESGELVEITIPITRQPLVLPCRILRQRPSDREEPLYAAQFTHDCNDAERMVREAVFSTHLAQSRGRSGGR